MTTPARPQPTSIVDNLDGNALQQDDKVYRPSEVPSETSDDGSDYRPFGLKNKNGTLFRHVCPNCSQSFKRRYALKDHMNSHKGEKPFVCPVKSCRRSFSTSGNLARHKRSHIWLQQPLQCLIEGCRASFSSDAKLERHLSSHFGEFNNHRCKFPSCDKVFSTVGNLHRHIRSKHGGQLRGCAEQAPCSSKHLRPMVPQESMEATSTAAYVVPSFSYERAETASSTAAYTLEPSHPSHFVSKFDESIWEALQLLVDNDEIWGDSFIV